MSCTQCGSRCQGGLCEQCAVEKRFAHLAKELAESGDEEVTDDE